MIGRTTAEHLSATTYCVVVGASEYDSSLLRPLPATAREAAEVASALTSPAGLAIPAENVTCLVAARATATAVRDALAHLRDRAVADSTLFVYFAGHGMALGNGDFGLCVKDTLPTGPMVTSSYLQELLNGCPARGIIFVLDCCGGAGLAECSPAMFSAVGQADFRVLMSASRLSQSSWETSIGSAFSKHLVSVLRGDTPIGEEPGFIYFNDLYTYLHDSVLEEHERALLPLQEPVFAGSYLRDPLLFVHGQLSRAQLVVKTKRYSREYLRGQLLRWGAGVALTAALLTGTYWTYLDQTEHVLLTDRGLLLRKGHPTLQGFGLPKDLWTFYAARDEILPQSSLAHGQAIVSAPGKSALPLIPQQLTPLGRIRWEWAEGDRVAGLQSLRTFVDDLAGKDPREIVRATQLLGSFGNATDVDRLLRVFPTIPPDYQREAARSIVRLGQADAFKRLLSGAAEGVGQALTPQTITELKVDCDEGLQQSIGTFAKSYARPNDIPTLFYMALATGCKIPLTLLGRAEYAHEDVVAAHVISAYPDQAPKIIESLTKTLEATARGEYDQSRVGAQVKLLTLLAKGRCPNIAGMAWIDPKWRLALDASLVLSRACEGRVLQVVGVGDAYELQLLAPGDAKPIVVQHIGVTMTDTSNLLEILQVMRRTPIAGDESLLGTLIESSSDEIVSRTAMQVLYARGIAPPKSVRRLFQTTYEPLATVAHVYWARTHRAEVLDALVQKLDDQSAEFVLMTLAFLKPSAAERLRILKAAASDRIPIARKATLAVMFGDLADVERTVCASNADIRSAGYQALGFRTDTRDVAAMVLPPECKYGRLAEGLRQIDETRSVLSRVLSAGPDDLRDLRVNTALFFHPTHNEGLRRWLRAQCLDCM